MTKRKAKLIDSDTEDDGGSGSDIDSVSFFHLFNSRIGS